MGLHCDLDVNVYGLRTALVIPSYIYKCHSEITSDSETIA
jgi:hypothetical protein